METRDNTTNGSNATDGGAGGILLEPQPLRWTLRLLFIIIFIVGSIGNLVVCMAVIRRKRMRTSNNIFTFNLALSDLMTVLIYVPTQMAAFENDHNWPLGDFGCRFSYIFIPVCFSASIATLLAITCDRYRAIAYPMRPRLSSKRVRVILVAIWTISVVVASPLIFVAREVRPTPGEVYCDEVWPGMVYGRAYWIFIFVIQYILPLGMICALAALIALKIRKNSLDMIKRTSHVVVAAVSRRLKQTSKITNMLIALVILYAICMLPQHLVYLFMVYGDLMKFKYRLYVLRFANIFPMANCALNPIAYGTLNKEFKMVFKSFFKCECHKFPAEMSRADTTHFSRSRKSRLAVYKHVDDEGHSVLEYGRKWRRKSSAMSLLSAGGDSRRQSGGAFKARKKSSVGGGGFKGKFAVNGGALSPNGHITRQMGEESLQRSSISENCSRDETRTLLSKPREELPTLKEVNIEEEERQNLLPARDDVADCSEKSYSSMSKYSEKSYSSGKSTSKSYPYSDTDDIPFGVYQMVVESNESAEEPDEHTLESLTNSLEWDPMTIGSLNRVNNNISENKYPLPLKTEDPLIHTRKLGRIHEPSLPLLSNFYNPVDNFEKFIYTENDGKLFNINAPTEPERTSSDSFPRKDSTNKIISLDKTGLTESARYSGTRNQEVLSSNTGSNINNFKQKTTGLQSSKTEDCIEESEIPDVHARPSEPILHPGEFDRRFLEYIHSVRETTV